MVKNNRFNEKVILSDDFSEIDIDGYVLTRTDIEGKSYYEVGRIISIYEQEQEGKTEDEIKSYLTRHPEYIESNANSLYIELKPEPAVSGVDSELLMLIGRDSILNKVYDKFVVENKEVYDFEEYGEVLKSEIIKPYYENNLNDALKVARGEPLPEELNNKFIQLIQAKYEKFNDTIKSLENIISEKVIHPETNKATLLDDYSIDFSLFIFKEWVQKELMASSAAVGESISEKDDPTKEYQDFNQIVEKRLNKIFKDNSFLEKCGLDYSFLQKEIYQIVREQFSYYLKIPENEEWVNYFRRLQNDLTVEFELLKNYFTACKNEKKLLNFEKFHNQYFSHLMNQLLIRTIQVSQEKSQDVEAKDALLEELTISDEETSGATIGIPKSSAEKDMGSLDNLVKTMESKLNSDKKATYSNSRNELNSQSKKYLKVYEAVEPNLEKYGIDVNKFKEHMQNLEEGLKFIQELPEEGEINGLKEEFLTYVSYTKEAINFYIDNVDQLYEVLERKFQLEQINNINKKIGKLSQDVEEVKETTATKGEVNNLCKGIAYLSQKINGKVKKNE